MDDEALNNNADRSPGMAWTPRLGVSRGARPPRIRPDDAAAASSSAFQHLSQRPHSSAPQMVGHYQTAPQPPADRSGGSGGAAPNSLETTNLSFSQPYRANSQQAGALPPVVQLQPFQSLRADSLSGSLAGNLGSCWSPSPQRRSTEEDVFGLSLRSLVPPSASLSFMSPAEQLLLSPPSGGSSSANGYGGMPAASAAAMAMPQYPAQRESK